MVLQALAGRLFGRVFENQSSDASLRENSKMRRPLSESLESRRYCYGLNGNSTSSPGDYYVNDSVQMELHFDVSCPGVYFEARITFPDSSTTTYDTNYVYSNDWEVDLGYLDTSQAGTMVVELWVEQNPQLMTLEERSEWNILEPQARNIDVHGLSPKFGDTAIPSEVGSSSDVAIASAVDPSADTIVAEESANHRGIFATAMVIIPGCLAAVKAKEQRTKRSQKVNA